MSLFHIFIVAVVALGALYLIGWRQETKPGGKRDQQKIRAAASRFFDGPDAGGAA